jgi:hypothetical protein
MKYEFDMVPITATPRGHCPVSSHRLQERAEHQHGPPAVGIAVAAEKCEALLTVSAI